VWGIYRPNRFWKPVRSIKIRLARCNNAKTDEFTEKEFKQIGQAIKAVWEERLKKTLK
jgi:hypothetical protein